MGKCIFRSSTCSNVSLFISFVTISDVSRSEYPPSRLHDVQVRPPEVAGFPASNAPSPIYNAAQKDMHPASDKEPAVVLRSRTTSSALSHLRVAGCRANQ